MIEFCEVTKTYGKPGKDTAAIRELSFYVQAGDFALLMGPSGAGKSTILKLILAMERPDSGTICVAGRDVHRLTRGSIPYLRRNLGVVFQDFKLLQEASPVENVALALQMLGIGRRETRRRARRALERVNLDPDLRKPVRQMSGGEQQRVALARALAGDPPILLADEPTGNLDPALTRDVLDAMDQIRLEGTTILMATHDPLVRDHVGATRLVYIENGHMVRNAPLSRRRAATGETDAVAVEVEEPTRIELRSDPASEPADEPTSEISSERDPDAAQPRDTPPTAPIGSSALPVEPAEFPEVAPLSLMGELMGEVVESDGDEEGEDDEAVAARDPGSSFHVVPLERRLLDALIDDEDDRILAAMIDDDDIEAARRHDAEADLNAEEFEEIEIEEDELIELIEPVDLDDQMEVA